MPLKQRFAPDRLSESGSVLTAALAVVVLVGTLSYTTYSLLSGPVRSAAVVTLKTKAQNELMIGAKLLMRAAADGDADLTPEPPAADPAIAAVASTNGGGIPTSIAAEKNDPWRTPYAYCAWNHGSNFAAGVGLIEGKDAPFNDKLSIALISAGPDRIFQTVCNTAGDLVTSGDDIVVRYTYDQSANIELWKESGGVGMEASSAAQNVGIGKAADNAIKLDVLGDSRLTGNLVVDTGTLTAGTVDINGGNIDGVAIAGSTINSSPIGGGTPSSGAFTTLNANAGTTTVGLTGTGTVTLTGTSGLSNIDNIRIGVSTPARGVFTNLEFTGSLTPPNTNVIANLNADLLDGNDGSFYQDASNLNAGMLDVARTPAYQGDVSKVAGDDFLFVESLQGYVVDLSVAPAANTVLGWDSSNNVWKPMVVEPGAGDAGTIGVSGVNYLATASAITSGNCSDGQVPKLVLGAWACAADSTGSITLPINADNATSPAGQVISINSGQNLLMIKNNSTILGQNAGSALSSGVRNTMIGENAGTSMTTANNSTYIGYGAGRYFTSANNVMIGDSAGVGVNGSSTGSSNVFVGQNAGVATTTGGSNIFIGASAGAANNTGFSNIYIGGSAGAAGTTSTNNVMIGPAAGLSTTSGSATFGNVYIGSSAGMYNGATSANVYVGTQAGQYLTGGNNTVIGDQAGLGSFGSSATSGNTIMGSNAATAITSGDRNTAIGQDAARALTTGANNVFVGRNAGRFFNSGANVMIGESAGFGTAGSSTGGNNVFVGRLAGTNATTGAQNIFIGTSAGAANTSSTGSVYVGYTAGQYFTGATNVMIGNLAGVGVNGSSTGASNVFIGSSAGTAVTTASSNVLVGASAGAAVTTGGLNVFIGANSGSATTTQTSSVYIGSGAGRYNAPSLTGANNVYIGNNAGLGVAGVSTGNSNTYVGASAGAASTTATNNATFGTSAGAALTTGDYNTMVGSAAGLVNQTGTQNAYFGNNAGRNFTGNYNTMVGTGAGIGTAGSSSGSSNTVLGRNAGAALTTASNNILIGAAAGSTLDTGGGNIIIGTSAPAPAANTANYLLIYGGGGDVLRGTMNSGNLSAQGAALGFHSDSRLKKDIETVESPVESLVKIRGVTFKWNGLTNKDTESTQYGVVAQEVENVFPHLVTLGPISSNGKRYLEVAYNGFIPILIEAVKEQQKQLEERDAQIARMQSDIDELKQAVKALQAAK